MPNFKIFNGKQYIYVDSFATKGEALLEAKRNTGFDTKIETAHNGFVLWRSATRKRSNNIRKIAKEIVSIGYCRNYIRQSGREICRSGCNKLEDKIKPLGNCRYEDEFEKCPCYKR